METELPASSEHLIEKFFADSDVQRLVNSTARSSPLQVCFPKEVNVSRLVAWLLDPSEGHGLGDLAIKSLLTQAWWNLDETSVPVATKRFLSPANVQTESFSACVVTTELELLKAGHGDKSLDVLIIDPTQRRYIAIENKYGAVQSPEQLREYRERLEKLFPSFLGVHILLDSSELEADDDKWVRVDYTWLTDFLEESESRSSTSPHVREALAQFREAVGDRTEEGAGSSPTGRLITRVAVAHAEVLSLLATWSDWSKASRGAKLAALIKSASTLTGKANLRLFQLYWRRVDVWKRCIAQVKFAPFVLAMERVEDLLAEPRRVMTAFSRARWESLVDPDRDSDFFAAHVEVRKTGDTFSVTTCMYLRDIRAEKLTKVVAAAEGLRKTSVKNARSMPLTSESDLVKLRIEKCSSTTAAVEELKSQFSALEQALASII